MEHEVLASVRADLIDEYLIAVQVGSDEEPEYEWASFTRRPAKALDGGKRYQVLLEDMRLVVADFIDLDLEDKIGSIG